MSGIGEDTAPAVRFTVAGRTFRSATPLSVAQLRYFELQLRQSGITHMPGTAEEYQQFTAALDEADRLKRVVSAMLVEESGGVAEKWSKAGADRVAEFLWSLDGDDLPVVNEVVRGVLEGFFPLAPGSGAPSPSSGNPPAITDSPESESPSVEVTTTSASGAI